jgi:hypothetical protein
VRAATFAVIALVSASEGYLFVALPIAWRALFLVAGVLLITMQALPALLGCLLLLGGGGGWLWARPKGWLCRARRGR